MCVWVTQGFELDSGVRSDSRSTSEKGAQIPKAGGHSKTLDYLEVRASAVPFLLTTIAQGCTKTRMCTGSTVHA